MSISIDGNLIATGRSRFYVVGVPPPPTDPYFSNVSLLLHCDGTNGSQSFTDNSLVANSITANGSAAINTSNPKFGTGAAFFSASGGGLDNLVVPYSTAVNFGGNNFTVETWIYITGGSGSRNIISKRNNSSVFGNWCLQLDSTNHPQVLISTSGAAFQINHVSSTALSLNTWNHLAMVRSGSTFYLFINGSGGSIGSNVNSMPTQATQNVEIGGYGGNNFPFTGYLDDIRITNGVARYTANFTPPTAAFPNS